VFTVAEGGAVPGTYHNTNRSDYGLREAEGCMGVATAKDNRELRSFLGLCTYYRRFIDGSMDIAKLLTQLTDDRLTFRRSSETKA
jgi:hypothetical protein